MSEISITTPRIGTNDDYVTIGQWMVPSGSKVSSGDEIVSLETTKETEEFKAEADGYLFYQHAEGDDVAVGDELAVISDRADFEFAKCETSLDDLNVTKKARDLIEKYQVDISKLDTSGIIREKDVLSLLHLHEGVTRSKANDVIIVSGGGLSKMCIDLLRLNKAYNIHGLTDIALKEGDSVLGVPVLGDDSKLDEVRNEGYMTAVNAVGSISVDNEGTAFHLRKKIFEKIKSKGFFCPTLIHPSAEVAPSAQLGEGVLVFEHAAIGPDAVIGDDAIINTGAIISHDCEIGAHSRISPGAVLAGDVKVGENSLIGMGTTIYIGVKIGRNVVIGNGQNIFSDVPDGAVIR